MQNQKILGVNVTTSPEAEILEYIITGLQRKSSKTTIFTPNPEIVVRAHNDKSYQLLINKADVSLPDGVGLVWASRILGKGSITRITGVDFMKSLCEKVAEKPVMVGLFGAETGVAERVAECLMRDYPGLKISYASDTWDEEKAKQAKIDILFVALGAPKQEEWIMANKDTLPIKVFMGVGGAFDMISGNVRRAPVWMRSAGFEWLFRLIRQPWRLKRQLALPVFTWITAKEFVIQKGPK